MATLILFNKPYGVLSQFTDKQKRTTLGHYIDNSRYKGAQVYPAGRLDRDSEGLLLLTDSGKLQHWIAGAAQSKQTKLNTNGSKSNKKQKQAKHYWVQVEGKPSTESLQHLRNGLKLNDGPTLPAKADLIKPPKLWERQPPIRYRKNQATQWLSIVINEGRNRQVRRMTAAIGHPTLRLIRHQIAHWRLGDLQPGEFHQETIHVPEG